MSLDNFVEQEVVSALHTELQQPIGQIVSKTLTGLLNDKEFTKALEDRVQESITDTLKPKNLPEQKYKTVAQFVDGEIRPAYPTTVGQLDQLNWSRRWYKHPEVVARLGALWVTFERLRREDKDGFYEKFLRVHADYHMRQIMADDGVFARCSRTDTKSVPLPVEPDDPSEE